MDNLANLSELKQQMAEADMKLKEKQKNLKELRAAEKEVKELNAEAIVEIQMIEKQLLEKEFELKEIEAEKNIRSQDAKFSLLMEELKKRQRGFLGQFFELIKPINPKYDLAVKVSLTKCLRFLVVDTAQTAKYVTEFLKEKGLQRDLLILENMPDSIRKNSNQISQIKLKELGGEFVLDRIDVSRKNDGLVQKAVDYFVADKIVCKDFDTVIKLQRQGQCRNIVTLDGIEYRQGMISGGTHSQNIFNINLGQYELDRDIKKLTDQIKKLSDKLDDLKLKNKDNLANEARTHKEINNLEFEIDNLQQTKANIDQ